MPRGMGRYSFFPYPRMRFISIGSIIDILLIIGIIIVLIHLFMAASIYVIMLIILVALRILIKPNYRTFRRIW